MIEPNAVASSTPMRLPNVPLTATWTDPARPATSERNHRNGRRGHGGEDTARDWAARAKVSGAGRE